MDDAMFSLILQGLQNLDRESSDKSDWNSSKFVILDKFIEVNAEQFERYHQMLSKYRIIFDSNNVVDILWIMLSKIVQYVKFNTSLMMKSFLVSDDFDSHKFIRLIVEAL